MKKQRRQNNCAAGTENEIESGGSIWEWLDLRGCIPVSAYRYSPLYCGAGGAMHTQPFYADALDNGGRALLCQV